MLAYYIITDLLTIVLVRDRLCQFVFEDFCIEKTDTGIQRQLLPNVTTMSLSQKLNRQ